MRRIGGVLFALLVLSLAPMTARAAEGGQLSLVGSVPFQGGTDMDFDGDLAFVGSWSSGPSRGLHVIDIADPESPHLIGRFACAGNQNDVGVWKGHDVVVMGMHSSGRVPGCTPEAKGGLRILDVSDPTAPRQLSFVEIGPRGTHTLTIVGDTGYVYSNPGGVSASTNNLATTIVDIRDPEQPKIVGSFQPPGSDGCHDVNVVGNRAYCAGTNVTQIWDITDPVHPTVVSAIVNPAIWFHHGAMPSSDGKTLVIADEAFGVHACDPTGKNPTGAYWFYDITVEQAPVLRGWIGQTEMTRIGHIASDWCTVHNFNMVPGRDWMVASAYLGGTSVIDFSNPSLPTIVSRLAPESADTWSGYYYDGYVYASDMARGFDVMRLDALLPETSGASAGDARPTRVRGARATREGRGSLPATGAPMPLIAVVLLPAAALVGRWLLGGRVSTRPAA